MVSDPLRSGLVPSLAHPGGNITGVSVDAGIEILGKRLQFLKEVVPSASRIAYLDMGSSPDRLVRRSMATGISGSAHIR